jgi:hypothetical protein
VPSPGSSWKRTDVVCIIRILPLAADSLSQRINSGNLGLRDPHSLIAGRSVLLGLFGGKVPLHRALMFNELERRRSEIGYFKTADGGLDFELEVLEN